MWVPLILGGLRPISSRTVPTPSFALTMISHLPSTLDLEQEVGAAEVKSLSPALVASPDFPKLARPSLDPASWLGFSDDLPSPSAANVEL